MVNGLVPALPLRHGVDSSLAPSLDILPPALDSLYKTAFRKLSDIQRNSTRSQRAFGYPFEAKMVSGDFRTTIRSLKERLLNSESFLVSFTG